MWENRNRYYQTLNAKEGTPDNLPVEQGPVSAIDILTAKEQQYYC